MEAYGISFFFFGGKQSRPSEHYGVASFFGEERQKTSAVIDGVSLSPGVVILPHITSNIENDFFPSTKSNYLVHRRLEYLVQSILVFVVYYIRLCVIEGVIDLDLECKLYQVLFTFEQSASRRIDHLHQAIFITSGGFVIADRRKIITTCSVVHVDNILLLLVIY